MPTLWFCLVAFMIAVYVLLDGFDLGAGIVHLGVAHTDAERRAVIGSIGPVWDGNEVWLLAGGGTLFFAFPVLYASSFSGFYLPLMMVSVASGAARNFHRISQPRRRAGVVAFMGPGVLRFERAPGDLLRRRARQRGSRRSPGRRRIFLRASLDQLHFRRYRRNSRLVHDLDRRSRLLRAGGAWSAVGGATNAKAQSRIAPAASRDSAAGACC